MGSLSNYGENAFVNHLCKNSAYTPVATVYLALATADPGEAATGASMNEVANSGSYARTAISFSAASSRRVTQSGAVNFPTASGSWGTVTHWAIVDSATYGAGNVLAYGAFANAKSIVSGNAPTVATTTIYVDITTGTGPSTYAANGFLDRMFRNQAFTVSANYCGLATNTLGDATSPTEPSGGSYARVQININGGASPAWSTVSGGAVSNGAAVTFPTPTLSWGTIVYMFIADASSAGNVLWVGDVTDQAVGIGDPVSFATGQIAISQG